MRKFKFRMWDKEANGWLEEADFILRHGGRFEITPFNLSEIELMQWTGLTDRNGCDIYGGDIVRYTHPAEYDLPAMTAIVPVEWDEETAGFGLGFISHRLTIYDDVEVIGNIYEHPHLLQSNQP